MQSRELGRHQRGKKACRLASGIGCKHCVYRVCVCVQLMQGFYKVINSSHTPD